ncbi:leucine-rich repeat protein, partial [Candidatus Poribacteria bacterium]|nr:leucine-rich repeat protein [Candidatus Poribacteria bacterium]
ELQSLPAGVFTGLMALETLRLDRNRIEPLPITISLQKVAGSQFKAMVQTGALFDIVIPINVNSGRISDGATQVIIPKGSVESRIFTVSRLPNTRAAVTVEIGTLPECPIGYSGCVLTASDVIPLELIKKINSPPIFKEGWLTTRVVMDRNFVGAPLGKPITAIDVDGDTLTYTLSGIDAQAFTLDGEGYLKTRTLLDSTHKSIYTVRVTASDDIDTDVITVVITLADANNPFKLPNFIPVIERTPQVRDAIVSALSDIRDADDVTLAHLATIRSLNLRGRGISELKSGDFSGLVALTDLNLHGNYLSTLPDGIFNDLPALRTLRLGRNVTDQMILPVQLLQVGDDQYKAVVPTGAPFDMSLPVSVTNGIMSDGPSPLMISKGSRESDIFSVACPLGRPISPTVALNILPKIPRNHYGYIFAQSTVYNRTPEVAKAITAAVPGITDPRYVTDLHLVTISNLSLNYGTITSLKTSDFAGLFALKTLSLNDNDLSSLPDNIFDGLLSLTHLDLSGNEFTGLSPRTFEELPYLSSLHLGTNKLTYLSEGMFDNITELERLHMDGNLVDPLQLWVTLEKVEDGQFKVVIPTGIPFDIDVPLIIKNGKMAHSGNIIGLSAGAVESYPITVTRNDGMTDAVTVDIGTLPSQPLFHTGYVLVKSDTLRLEVMESIKLPPVFTEGETTVRTVPENTSAGINIGAPITATDPNTDDRLIYTLGGPDASSFNIDSQTGQLKTKTPLDYETRDIYTGIVNVSDGNTGNVSITVTINVSNVNEVSVFTEGSSITRTIAENTDSGTNIGNPITAMDPDGDTLTYSLGGPDANAFYIDSNTAQLQTSAALDYEGKASYTATITATDGKGGTASANITINITDIDEQPVIETPDPISEQPENSAPVFT